MIKKLISFSTVIIIVFSVTANTFAAMQDNQNIEPNSNRIVVVKDYYKTNSGTEYENNNPSKALKMVVWKEDVYKVYHKNLATGKKSFQYYEYRWEWTGFRRTGYTSNWIQAKSASGVSREHYDIAMHAIIDCF